MRNPPPGLAKGRAKSGLSLARLLKDTYSSAVRMLPTLLFAGSLWNCGRRRSVWKWNKRGDVTPSDREPDLCYLFRRLWHQLFQSHDLVQARGARHGDDRPAEARLKREGGAPEHACSQHGGEGCRDRPSRAAKPQSRVTPNRAHTPPHPPTLGMVSASVPIQSPHDKKLYRHIRLSNGLTALLISDPEIKTHALDVRLCSHGSRMHAPR